MPEIHSSLLISQGGRSDFGFGAGVQANPNNLSQPKARTHPTAESQLAGPRIPNILCPSCQVTLATERLLQTDHPARLKTC